MAGAGTGAATTLAITGVRATGSSAVSEAAVADAVVSCEFSVDDEQEATVSERARSAAMVGSGRRTAPPSRFGGSPLVQGGVGVHVLPVRNMKKNITQPIAEMKIQPTSR